MIKILDERKLEILVEIVESFIETEEPVGSKTLSEKSSIGVSPATIRNEMRVLEELGFIMKTHSSSGRIPSDKGYREYVNLRINPNLHPNKDFIQVFTENINYKESKFDEILELSSDLFAKKTNYTTVIIAPISKFQSIQYLMLDSIDDGKIIAIYIDVDDQTETEVIYYDEFSNDLEIHKYNKFINSQLAYKSSEELKELYNNMPLDYPHQDFSKVLIKYGIEFLEEKRKFSVFSSGLGNLLKFSEDTDYENVKSMIDFIEDEDNLISLWSEEDYKNKINIRIGRENKENILKNASVISTKYDSSKDDYGSINIIGPTHMDYKYLVETLLGLSNALNSLNKWLKR